MKLIIISGRANSGKTNLRNFLSNALKIKSISSSDYTKSLTNDFSRENLENIFNTLVEKNGYDQVVQNILDFGFLGCKYGIIDGIRHQELIESWQKIVGIKNFFLIYIELSLENRFLLAQKAQRNESFNLETFIEFEKKSTHENKSTHIKNLTDEIIGDEYIGEKEKVEKFYLQKIQTWIS